MSAALFHRGTKHPDGFHDVEPTDLHHHKHESRMIDVREHHELSSELGHIQGIEHVPLSTIQAAARQWPKDQPIVIICRSGGRSSSAARALVNMGFERVMNLRGGMLAYHAAGFPTER